MTKNIKVAFLALAVAATGLTSNTAAATAIMVTGLFHSLENRGDNSVGIRAGVRQFFGATSVVPNGDNGTSGVATQDGVTVPLNFDPIDVAPNAFDASIAFDPSLTGSWTLTFTNGPDTRDKVTPTIIGVQVVPLVNNVTKSGSGAAPSFNWTVPNTFAPDGIRIEIRDKTEPIQEGAVTAFNVIYSQIFPSTTTSFTLDPTDPGLTQPLQLEHTYSLEIDLLDTRDNLASGGRPNIFSMSRTFFDFSLQVPEPSVFALFGLGLVWLGLVRCRQRA
jgi:hypothetical protein